MGPQRLAAIVAAIALVLSFATTPATITAAESMPYICVTNTPNPSIPTEFEYREFDTYEAARDSGLFDVGAGADEGKLGPAPGVEVVPCKTSAPPPVDSDGDGVSDDLDQCPNTPTGVAVGADGCPLPPTNTEVWMPKTIVLACTGQVTFTVDNTDAINSDNNLADVQIRLNGGNHVISDFVELTAGKSTYEYQFDPAKLPAGELVSWVFRVGTNDHVKSAPVNCAIAVDPAPDGDSGGGTGDSNDSDDSGTIGNPAAPGAGVADAAGTGSVVTALPSTGVEPGSTNTAEIAMAMTMVIVLAVTGFYVRRHYA